MVLLSREAALYVTGKMTEKKNITIVIDSGHGGMDPGKIAADGTLEKDLNLSIALKLQKYLEAADIRVVMTRTNDMGLYDENAPNKKVQDMKNRIALMEDCNADLVVSIHQNSYSDSAIHGAQVFYYGQSEQGAALAGTLQKSLISRIDPENKREAKANESYYLLKKTPTPTVIVECGFLSNPTEADLLLDADYQDKLARAIYMGILEYLEAESLL